MLALPVVVLEGRSRHWATVGLVVVVVAVMVGRKLGLAIERRRRVVGSCISVVGLSLVWSVWLLMKVGMLLVVRLGEAEMGWFRGWCGRGCTL